MPPLTLADWTAPAGIVMRVLALIETGTLAGDEVFDTADNRGSLVDGDNILENVDGADSITVGGFRAKADGGNIALTRSAGSVNFSAGFGGEVGESYAGATTYIQFADGTVIELEDSDINNVSALRLRYDVPNTAGWRDAVVTLRTSGVLFILGVGLPVGPLRDLRVSVGGRDYSDHVERGDWRIIRRTGVRSEARFRIVAKPGEIVIPRNGEAVIATATLGGIVTLFGGYLDEPEIDAYTGIVGLYDLNLQSIGFRARLDDTLLTQLQGIDIVQLATAAEQIEALAAVLSGEGFTASVTLPADDTPSAEGMRLRHIGPLLDGVASLNNAIPVVSAEKVVSVVARDLVTGDLVLDDTNTEPAAGRGQPAELPDQPGNPRRRPAAHRGIRGPRRRPLQIGWPPEPEPGDIAVRRPGPR